MGKRHAEKVQKYQRIKTFLEGLGWRVHVSALVYGALGSVLPSNFKTLAEHLRLTKRAATKLNRRISATCVKASYRIWRLHAGEINADDTSRNPGPTSSAPVPTPAAVTTTRNPATVASTASLRPRRTSTRWGPPRVTLPASVLPPKTNNRTSTRWGPRLNRAPTASPQASQPAPSAQRRTHDSQQRTHDSQQRTRGPQRRHWQRQGTHSNGLTNQAARNQ